jgi:hypothetical protein
MRTLGFAGSTRRLDVDASSGGGFGASTGVCGIATEGAACSGSVTVVCAAGGVSVITGGSGACTGGCGAASGGSDACGVAPSVAGADPLQSNIDDRLPRWSSGIANIAPASSTPSRLKRNTRFLHSLAAAARMASADRSQPGDRRIAV